MKFNILKPALAALVLVGTACTANYLDINTNPYEPSEDDMQTDGYIIGSALTSLASTVVSTDVNTAQFTDVLLGGCAIDACGKPFPDDTEEKCKACCWAAPWVGIIPRRVALPVRS